MRQAHRSFFMLLTSSCVDWLCVLLRFSVALLSDTVRASARARLTVPPRRSPHPAARENMYVNFERELCGVVSPETPGAA